jgi:hypothetical protein
MHASSLLLGQQSEHVEWLRKSETSFLHILALSYYVGILELRLSSINTCEKLGCLLGSFSAIPNLPSIYQLSPIILTHSSPSLSLLAITITIVLMDVVFSPVQCNLSLT